MHGNNPRKRHGISVPNGHEKAQARRIIADAQKEAQRIAQMESALHAAAGRIEAYRRIMYLMIATSPGQEIRIPQSEIDRVYKDAATAKTSVFEVDAETVEGFICYRIPTAETLAAAERVKSIMEHAEDGAAAADAARTEEPPADPGA